MVLIGSRVHVAVSRNNFDCKLYVNGQPAGHAISTTSVVPKNSFLVFGVDYRNNSNFFKGAMDHIAIYSQSLSALEINSLYNSELVAGAPTPMPSNNAGALPQQQRNESPSVSRCDLYCIIGSLGGMVVGVLAIFATYHVYYLSTTRRKDAAVEPPSYVVTHNNRYHAV